MKRLAAAAAVLVAAGCGGDLSPQVELFTATPTAIALGGSAVLNFSADLASSVTIDQGIGDVTGKKSVTVTPSATTTYTLTATRPWMGTILRNTATVTVTVGHGAASQITVAGMP